MESLSIGAPDSRMSLLSRIEVFRMYNGIQAPQVPDIAPAQMGRDV
jgi:hypothetical protein